ncbi:hypothetical protein SAMN04488034_1242, partial [Salinimicrobium catena]
MKKCTLNFCKRKTGVGKLFEKGFKSSLSTLFLLTLFFFASTESYAQLSCDHVSENFVTSDPSCPGSEEFNIAKIDRSITHEIFYVKVSGDACCGNFLINPKSGPNCYFDTSIAGPSGPGVMITEVGTVSNTCDFGDLTQCPDYGADYDKELIIRCSDGSIGHRITFLGSFEDGTDSYWYYEVENNVDGCINDISHLAFGVIDDSVCCIDYMGQTSAVCEGEDSEFKVTPTGADDYLFFIDEDGNDMYDGAVDTFLAQGTDNIYSGVHINNEVISVLVTDGTKCEDYLEITADVYPLPMVTADDDSVCIGSTVQLSATPSGGTWSGMHVSATGLFDADGLAADDYRVTYTFTDGNGCENSDTA